MCLTLVGLSSWVKHFYGWLVTWPTNIRLRWISLLGTKLLLRTLVNYSSKRFYKIGPQEVSTILIVTTKESFLAWTLTCQLQNLFNKFNLIEIGAKASSKIQSYRDWVKSFLNKFNPIEIYSKASSKVQSYRDWGKNSTEIQSYRDWGKSLFENSIL